VCLVIEGTNEMKAADIMTPKALSVGPDASIVEACR
jgi:hypothetical protein